MLDANAAAADAIDATHKNFALYPNLELRRVDLDLVLEELVERRPPPDGDEAALGRLEDLGRRRERVVARRRHGAAVGSYRFHDQ